MPCQLTDADELPVGGHGGSAAGPAGVADLAADVAEGRSGQAPLGSFTYEVLQNFGTYGPPSQFDICYTKRFGYNFRHLKLSRNAL